MLVSNVRFSVLNWLLSCLAKVRAPQSKDGRGVKNKAGAFQAHGFIIQAAVFSTIKKWPKMSKCPSYVQAYSSRKAGEPIHPPIEGMVILVEQA
jgi:hypothetical protein